LTDTPVALAVDLDRYASDLGVGQKHQKTGRQGDVGGQSRALGTDRVFDDLNHQFLTLAHQIGNGEHPVAVRGRTAFGHGFGADVG